MTLSQQIARRFGSPYRTHPEAVAQWMRETGRRPTAHEIAKHFAWSMPHTFQVLSRMSLNRVVR